MVDIYIILFLNYNIIAFLSLFIYFERQRERERERQTERVHRGGADRVQERISSWLHTVNTEPDTGLYLMKMRSYHEPKSRVGCLPD